MGFSELNNNLMDLIKHEENEINVNLTASYHQLDDHQPDYNVNQLQIPNVPEP